MSVRLRDDQRGVTLIELLVASTVALFVMSATLALVLSSQHAAARVVNRVDATQTGRTALDRLIQEVRSQSCLAPGYPAIAIADAQKLRLYMNMITTATATTAYLPQMREYNFVTQPSGRSNLIENVWTTATTPAPPATVTWTATPGTQLIANNILPGDGAESASFRYYAYDPSVSNGYVRLPTPVSAANLPLIVRIEVVFSTRPAGSNAYDNATIALRSSAYSRTANPYTPSKGPACI